MLNSALSLQLGLSATGSSKNHMTSGHPPKVKNQTEEGKVTLAIQVNQMDFAHFLKVVLLQAINENSITATHRSFHG